MGVWDMMYRVQKYEKLLQRSENPLFCEATKAGFAEQAEVVRAHMHSYMERVEKQIEELESKKETL
jgi:hypothetical protein